MGWGSSIEVGRLARAAEDALRQGNPGAAADYAQRAVKAAPQDNKLWFLLGYTSRLAGRYQTSVDAYQHGLQTAPGNADGLSGLAQTYASMGRTDDAKRLLLQVIRANPNRTNDLLIAGEMLHAHRRHAGGNQPAAARGIAAAERARRADAGGGLSEVEAARPRQTDARPGEEACAGQRRDLPGGGKLLPRRTRLQVRDRDLEERAANDSAGTWPIWVTPTNWMATSNKRPKPTRAPPMRSRRKLATS